MTKLPTNSNFSKSKGQVILEYILFAVCLCVIAIRTTFTEGPSPQSATQPINLGGGVYSLSISAILILSFVFWLVWSFCIGRFLYRFTAMEIGLAVFIIAAVIAGPGAPNKRAAINAFVVTIAPVLCAVLLVQILDSHLKIKILLTVIAALGVVSAYQCAEQFFVSNQITIEQYEQAPWTMLEPLGIQPGSFNQVLFEHRLYTRGVRGFFTTGNSAGSFALLASFASVALFLERFKNRKSDLSGPLHLVCCGIAVAAVLFGLAITRSKGAIIASLIAAAMFITYLCFSRWLTKHKKVIVISCLLIGLLGGCAVVLYGLAHGRLPGGNSMLVRWQYWQASAQMYADHLFTGVGPGNFAHFYTHYKPAAALETVADPHSFLLSVLTQYGPLGLVGFLALVSVPLCRAASAGPVTSPPKTHRPGPAFRTAAITFVIIISAALLLVRPIIMPAAASDTLDVTIYVMFILYVLPVIAFVAGFWLLTAGLHRLRNTNITAAALFCALIGCLIHNLIDFAIFEPGVFMTFWAIIACLIALDYRQKARPYFALKPPAFVKVITVAAAVILVWAYFSYALVPVAKAAAKTERSLQELEYAHELLDSAAEDDRLDPAVLNLSGRLYLQHYKETGKNQPALLERAEESFYAAIRRNKADFKNFERLAEVYNLLAETSTQEKSKWLEKAYDLTKQAVERYPGCGRLRFELAKIAEQTGKTQVAIEQYEKAVEIEDAYRNQFRLMYPGREVFSRLGEEKYNFAKQRIKQLCEKPAP